MLYIERFFTGYWDAGDGISTILLTLCFHKDLPSPHYTLTSIKIDSWKPIRIRQLIVYLFLDYEPCYKSLGLSEAVGDN